MENKNIEELNKFYSDIKIHVEMMVDNEMRAHACADANHHDLSFQIFRLISGYNEALDEIKAIKKASFVEDFKSLCDRWNVEVRKLNLNSDDLYFVSKSTSCEVLKPTDIELKISEMMEE